LRPIVIAISLLFSLSASAQNTPLRIGTITVRPLDIYSEAEAQRGWVYRAADRLHIETRASVIRKFLLFHEGEEFHPDRLAETERNLRALPFIKASRVTASEPHDGVVDVIVETQDAWSIAPETQAASKGGSTSYGATISESNLLGLGKEVSIKWSKNIDRRRFGIDYQDPAVNSWHWSTHLAYAINSDGHDRTLAIRRPFYSFGAPWSVSVVAQNLRQDDHLYTDGTESSRFRRDHRDMVLSFGRALRPNDLEANRIVGGLRLVRDDFSRRLVGDQPLPDGHDFRYFFVRFEHAENDFVTLNFVNKDLRYEDFNLGRQYTVATAVSPRLAHADTNTFSSRATMSDGIRLGDATFVTASMSAESRFASGPANSVLGGSLHFVSRNDSTHPRTTVGRIVFTSGWRLDREVQFFADGDTGLRAYKLHELEGSRTFIANLEQRLYLGREIGQLASPGLVAFIDAGNATYGGLSSLFQLRTDVGIGIRIGLPRTPKNLLRLDLAYPLRRGNFDRHGLVVSFSSGQAF
jgi:hypothetical protein